MMVAYQDRLTSYLGDAPDEQSSASIVARTECVGEAGSYACMRTYLEDSSPPSSSRKFQKPGVPRLSLLYSTFLTVNVYKTLVTRHGEVAYAGRRKCSSIH
jgi:hypothetical protein